MTRLDPQFFDLKQMMKEHAKGKTTLFSTHVLEVARASLVIRIAILKKGHLIYVVG